MKLNAAKIGNYLGFIATGILVVVGSIYIVRYVDKKTAKKGSSTPSVAATTTPTSQNATNKKGH